MDSGRQIEIEADLRRVEVGGMVFEWRVEKDRLLCKLSGPTTGWVAVGFNTKAELAGTNLIMGCVEHGVVRIEDRYILQPGLHKSKLELGSSDRITDKGGQVEKGVTRLRFAIGPGAIDEFSYTLKTGEPYHILLAYSRETDFMHHSIMRTELDLVL